MNNLYLKDQETSLTLLNQKPNDLSQSRQVLKKAKIMQYCIQMSQIQTNKDAIIARSQASESGSSQPFNILNNSIDEQSQHLL